MLPAVTAITGQKHPRDSDNSVLPAAKEARSEPNQIDYQEGFAVLKLAKACLEQLRNAAMIPARLKTEWMKQFIHALSPDDFSISSDHCKKIAKQIYAYLLKTPFTAQIKESPEYKHLSQGRNRGLSELLQEARLFCDCSLENFVAELRRLASSSSNLKDASEALVPFMVRIFLSPFVTPQKLFDDLVIFFTAAPSFPKDLRVQESLQQLLPIWRSQLLAISTGPGDKQLIEEQYQRICSHYQMEKLFAAKLQTWILNPQGSLPEIQLFLKPTNSSKCIQIWKQAMQDGKKPKPVCVLQSFLQITRQQPEILENEQIKALLPKLIVGLWETIKRMPFSSTNMFAESAAAAALLNKCDPHNERPSLLLEFQDKATATLDDASAEAFCALSQPFVNMREDKSRKGLPITVPFTKAQFDAFYRILRGDTTFDPSGFIENLSVADYFACNSFMDTYFNQIEKFLTKRGQTDAEKYSKLETLCMLNDALVPYPKASETMKKWEQTRDRVLSHLINDVSIKAKASTPLLVRMSKLLQKSRTQKWPCTLYLLRDDIDEEILIHFQDLLMDVTRIVTNAYSKFEKVNQVLQRTPKLRQLESNHIHLPLLAHYCPGLEKLIVLAGLPQLKDGSLPLPHLRQLALKNSGLGRHNRSILTLESPFNQAMPNLETFEVMNMDFDGTLSFDRLQGIATIICSQEQFTKLQQDSFFSILHQKFPFVKEVVQADQKSPPARYNLISHDPGNLRLIPIAVSANFAG
ncbi:MAG: hypothetical protein LLG04_11815 [Parachlamydia sp.]|nr:hypothetical protein [Parachlamydia sp.]